MVTETKVPILDQITHLPSCRETSTSPARQRDWLIFTTILLVFVLLAGISAFTFRPWCDEAWFSSPAQNLLLHGSMYTSVLDPTASWRRVNLTGIEHYTYWVMPFYLLIQVPWYAIFGIGLMQMRCLSILFGLLDLAFVFAFIRRLGNSVSAALLAVVLVAIDFQFVTSSSVGRMDIVAAAFGMGSLALYLMVRQRSLSAAIFCSQAMAAGAGMCHPMAAVYVVDLVFLTLYFDRKMLRWQHLPLALVPYVVAATGWGLYIAKAPAIFVAQFSGNASNRLGFFASPLKSLGAEISARYLANFGFVPGASAASRLKILVLSAYFLGVIAALVVPRLRNNRKWRALLACGVLTFLGVAVLDTPHQIHYLVHTTMFFAMILAVCCFEGFKSGRIPRLVLGFTIGVLAMVQVAVTASRARQDPYHQDFLPAAVSLRQHSPSGKMAMASAEFAFPLGFDSGLVDDFRLGFRSGKRPLCLVLDRPRYDDNISHLREQDPANYNYIQSILETDYQQVYNRGYYRLFCRNDL